METEIDEKDKFAHTFARLSRQPKHGRFVFVMSSLAYLSLSVSLSCLSRQSVCLSVQSVSQSQVKSESVKSSKSQVSQSVSSDKPIFVF